MCLKLNTAATSRTLQLGSSGPSDVAALPGERRRSTRQQLNAASRARGEFWFEFPLQYRKNFVDPARKAAACNPKGPVVFELHGCKVEVLSLSPFIVEIENLLTPAMVTNLLGCVDKGKWLRSTTTNERGRAVRDDNRTSSTMSADSVLPPSALDSILHRVARFTGFNYDAVERPVPIVGYDEDQFYGPHHDAGTIMNRDGSPCDVLDSSTSPTTW